MTHQAKDWIILEDGCRLPPDGKAVYVLVSRRHGLMDWGDAVEQKGYREDGNWIIHKMPEDYLLVAWREIPIEELDSVV